MLPGEIRGAFPALLAASLAVIATLAGCQKETAAPTVADPPAGSRVEVVGGMENEIFTAQSGQHIALTEGTTANPVTNPDGVVTGVSIARDNSGGIDVSCDCPGGCTEGDGTPGGPGCVVGIPTGGHDASCSGSCSAPNKSCMGCSFSFPQPEAGSLHAKWVKRKDLAATKSQ